MPCLLMVHQRCSRELELQLLEKKKHEFVLCQSMFKIIKGQGHLLWTIRDLSDAFGSWGGICKFKFILSSFDTPDCADYFVLHINLW